MSLCTSHFTSSFPTQNYPHLSLRTFLTSLTLHFYCASIYAGVVLGVVILSVHPSVTPVHCDKTKWCTVLFWYHTKRQLLSFLIPTVIVIPSEICAQSDQPPSKNADFNIFPRITSQPLEIVKKFKWQIGSRPSAFQQAIDRVCTLPLSPQRVAQKAIFFVFKNRSQL